MSFNNESQLKLRPVLIPKHLQRRSVFYALSRYRWRKLREMVKTAADGACEICGAKRDRYMVCHEDWHYDDEKHIATLIRFMLICPDCNAVIHIGGTGHGWSGGLDEDPFLNVLPHLMKVNEIDFEDAIALLNEANHEYDERSQHKWTIAINPTLLDQFPILAELQL